MRLLVGAVALAWTLLASAIDSGQHFEHPAVQARYEALIHDLRCPMCQNESIADSNATVAADLRREVRAMIAAGRSDDEIRAFLTERYGDFVLFRPPVAPRTWLLWAAPALFLAGGLLTVALVIVRRARAAHADPSALDEEPDRP